MAKFTATTLGASCYFNIIIIFNPYYHHLLSLLSASQYYHYDNDDSGATSIDGKTEALRSV